MSFCTVVNCMDGRVQLPVIRYLQDRIEVLYVDSVTEPGPVRSLAEPVVEYLPGWSEDLREVRSIEKLPTAARDYLDRIEALIGVPIAIVSVGPERTQTLMRT